MRSAQDEVEGGEGEEEVVEKGEQKGGNGGYLYFGLVERGVDFWEFLGTGRWSGWESWELVEGASSGYEGWKWRRKKRGRGKKWG